MKRILLLGSGELGKEVVISAKRLGMHVVACDNYFGAPAMSVADHDVTFDMLDAKQLERVIDKYKPDYIVPEIEAIATEVLLKKEAEGYTVVPSAKAVNLTMNRDKIRDRAAELGIRTARFSYAESLASLYSIADEIGYPCVIKPVMSSSGKGQSIANSVEDLASSWQYAVDNMRGDREKVIIEEFIKFDYEITLLTIKQQNGPTLFCPPIGHHQESGDYKHSWQPATEETFTGHIIESDARQIAKTITDDLGGSGIFGVEFFVITSSDRPEVIFSELSPRPHDTGMITMISQELSEFDLHVRAFTGLPIPEIKVRPNKNKWASATINIPSDTKSGLVYDLEGIEEALELGCDIRIFGKPSTKPNRRVGVLLSNNLDTALEAQKLVKIKTQV